MAIVKKPGGFHHALQALGTVAPAAFPADVLQSSAWEHIVRHLLVLTPALPLTAARFDEMLAGVRRDLPKLTWDVATLAKQILGLRGELLALPKAYKTLAADVERLVPPDFLLRTPHAQLLHLPRYLKAISIRARTCAFKSWQGRGEGEAAPASARA